ncbi:MAG TPA: hypothetical protein PKK15_07840 [Kouleothrix sp.]|nr:hypothetical protein [Kouleothrix sp.]
MQPEHDDHHSIMWPLLIRAAVYGLPLAGLAGAAWLAWRALAAAAAAHRRSGWRGVV